MVKAKKQTNKARSIKDTNYCELLNISGYRKDTVKESLLCKVLSPLKIRKSRICQNNLIFVTYYIHNFLFAI